MANGRNPGAARKVRGGRVRSLRKFPKAIVSMTFVSNMAENLKKLDTAIKEKVIRPTAYAGAKILYDEMRLQVPIDSGNLYESIYHWFDTKESTPLRKVYAIGPNKAKAPHWYNVEYGHWRYNKIVNGRALKSKSDRNARVSTPGTRDSSVHDLPGALEVPVWVPANPYIRITYDANIQRAMEAMKRRFGERLSEVIREVNGG